MQSRNICFLQTASTWFLDIWSRLSDHLKVYECFFHLPLLPAMQTNDREQEKKQKHFLPPNVNGHHQTKSVVIELWGVSFIPSLTQGLGRMDGWMQETKSAELPSLQCSIHPCCYVLHKWRFLDPWASSWLNDWMCRASWIKWHWEELLFQLIVTGWMGFQWVNFGVLLTHNPVETVFQYSYMFLLTVGYSSCRRK